MKIFINYVYKNEPLAYRRKHVFIKVNGRKFHKKEFIIKLNKFILGSFCGILYLFL